MQPKWIVCDGEKDNTYTAVRNPKSAKHKRKNKRRLTKYTVKKMPPLHGLDMDVFVGTTKTSKHKKITLNNVIQNNDGPST